MSKNILTYIHNNHTTPILYKIDVPESTEINRIESLKNYTYSALDTNIIMIGLSGILEKRQEEDQIIKDIIDINKKIKPTFLIIRPFEFESGVDLAYVSQNLDLLKQSGVDFEVLDLDEFRVKSPNITFAEAYSKIQEIVELICSVKFKSFVG